jgi:regulator of nucleoside diphosphate kinase
MPRRKIVITEADEARLKALLASEFAAAIGPVEFLDDLRAEVERAEVVPPMEVPQDVVTMNSVVTLGDLATREAETFVLVYPEFADIANNRLSILAPVGTAILGQRVGDVLKWRVPQGWRKLKVERVLYQPERAGVFRDDVDDALRPSRRHCNADANNKSDSLATFRARYINDARLLTQGMLNPMNISTSRILSARTCRKYKDAEGAALEQSARQRDICFDGAPIASADIARELLRSESRPSHDHASSGASL